MSAILSNIIKVNNKINMSQPIEKEYYGSKFGEEKQNSIIYILLNINGLKMNSWKAKNAMLCNFLVRSKVDLIGLQEININWDIVDYKDRWQEISLRW